MKICFAGDLFLGGDLRDLSTCKSVTSKAFLLADKRIVNLEQPISENTKVEDKCTLFTGTYGVQQLKDLNIDAVNLAHNHIQDKGLDGIIETIEHLNDGSIKHFGAGKNIKKAKTPYWLSEDVALLGYCEFDKPYLKQITIADDNNPGVNPLRYKNILENLDALPIGKEAILYFHWGREHVWLPPRDDIEIAKKLLEHEKVRLIIGMHAHRAQGYIEHNGKRAYMCLGNFLFPNFYIAPPTQIYYPETRFQTHYITRQYHTVSKITYKKWYLSNRVSLILNYSLDTKEINHHFVVQRDDRPVISDLNGLKLKIFTLFIYLLSRVYALPKWIYIPLEVTSTRLTIFFWRGRIALFYLKQIGLKALIIKKMRSS